MGNAQSVRPRPPISPPQRQLFSTIRPTHRGAFRDRFKWQAHCRFRRQERCLSGSNKILPERFAKIMIDVGHILHPQSRMQNGWNIILIIYSLANMYSRNSLGDKVNNLSKCDICFSDYNRSQKQPVIICVLHHTVCRQCLRDLQTVKKCPFCHQPIDFSKIVVNNYILEMLPSNPIPQPNTRTQIPQQAPQIQAKFTSPTQQEPPRYITTTTGNNYQPQSFNYQQPQPAYPPNYYQPQPVEPEHPNNPALDQEQIEHQVNQPFQMNDCWGSIQQRLGLHIQPDRKVIYIIIFILQFPFLFFDLLISLTAEDRKCMDTPYARGYYVLRPWLLAMAITEATIMMILLIGAFLRVCTFISHKCLKIFEYISLGILLVKILLWIYMELALFFDVIQPHCSGGVYAYGLIQTIIHGTIVIIFLLAAICGRKM